MRSLQGKGWFIWQIPRCEGGDPEAIAGRAVEAGCTHVLLKVAERTFAFGLDRFGRDLAAPVVAALQARGLQAWGWHYVYGDNPTGEAAVAVQRTRQLKLDGYVIDAEKEYKLPGKAVAARMYMNTLRQGLPETPIALSSYRYPSLHQQLPWAVFLEKCDYAMPQVYWEQAHNPAQQLARCVAEYSDARLVGAARPVIPTGAAYGVGQWRSTPGDLREFFRQALALKLPAANLYSWDFTNLPGNADLWEAAARVDWPGPEGEPDIVARWGAALNAGDLDGLLALYDPNPAHITPRRTLVGREPLRGWYTDLLQARLRGARFTVQPGEPFPGATPASGAHFRRFRWQASAGEVQVEADDIIGLRDGRIAYHTTSFALL